MNDHWKKNEENKEITPLDASTPIKPTGKDLEEIADAIVEAGKEIREETVEVDVKALAATLRAAMNAGHPDAGKHLEALLTALGV